MDSHWLMERESYQPGWHAKGDSGHGCWHWKPSAQTGVVCGSQAGMHFQPSQTFPAEQ